MWMKAVQLAVIFAFGCLGLWAADGESAGQAFAVIGIPAAYGVTWLIARIADRRAALRHARDKRAEE